MEVMWMSIGVAVYLVTRSLIEYAIGRRVRRAASPRADEEPLPQRRGGTRTMWGDD